MSLIFDGHDLEALFICGEPGIVLTNPAPVLVELGGRDGAAVRSTRLAPKSIAFQATAIGNAQERAAALSTLAGWLNVSEPRPLYLPDTPDRYYMALPYNAQQEARYIDGSKTHVEFIAVEPAAYGEEQTATLPSGGSVTIEIGGNYPAFLYGNGSVKRDTTSGFYTITTEAGEFLEIPTGNNNARAVAFDCEARTLTVAGATTLPSVNSDWLQLAPGAHTLTNSAGENDLTIKWRERWL